MQQSYDTKNYFKHISPKAREENIVRCDIEEQTKLFDKGISRRSFIVYSLGTIAASVFGPGIAKSAIRINQTAGTEVNPKLGEIRLVPPLFCTAYVTPDAPGQEGQEALVARYSLALVPQDMRKAFVQWRNRVKEINPSIVLLGYLLATEEHTVPGPGHSVLRNDARNAWSVYPGGAFATTGGKTYGGRSIYDPRKSEWRNAFLAACRATLASYPYDGLFLDNCTIFERAHPYPVVKREMRQALQEALLELRKEFPNILIVGNSRYNWEGLNGELNEGQPEDMESEFGAFPGHVTPRINLYQSVLRNPSDIKTVEREMVKAHSLGAFYAAALYNDHQHILWFDAFDEVIAAYKR